MTHECHGDLTSGGGALDHRIYDDIKLYRAAGRLILSIGGYEWELTPEQEKQFRDELREVKVAPAL